MIPSFNQRGSVQVGAGIRVETTALNEYKDGMRLGIVGGSVDIEEKAVFGESCNDTGGWGRKTDSSVLESVSIQTLERQI